MSKRKWSSTDDISESSNGFKSTKSVGNAEIESETIDDIFSKMDQTIVNCDFDNLQIENAEDIAPRAISQSEMYEASKEYSKHHHRIQSELMKKGQENAENFVEEFKEIQGISDTMLRKFGSGYNDIISMDSLCQRELGEVFVTASATRLKTTQDFNWVLFKNNIREELKKNCALFGMTVSEKDGLMFENCFPTMLLTSRNDTRLDYDFSSMDLNAIETEDAKNPSQIRRRNFRSELNKTSQASQPTVSVNNKEDDRELISKLERRIIAVEKEHGRKPMPLIKLACDPTSFQNTVENFSKLSFLLQQGILLYFIKDGVKMVITHHNAGRTGLKIPDPGIKSQYIHYDVRTWEYWIKKFNVQRSFLKDL